MVRGATSSSQRCCSARSGTYGRRSAGSAGGGGSTSLVIFDAARSATRIAVRRAASSGSRPSRSAAGSASAGSHEPGMTKPDEGSSAASPGCTSLVSSSRSAMSDAPPHKPAHTTGMVGCTRSGSSALASPSAGSRSRAMRVACSAILSRTHATCCAAALARLAGLRRGKRASSAVEAGSAVARQAVAAFFSCLPGCRCCLALSYASFASR